MKTNHKTSEEWWASLSNGEKDLIRTLMRMIRSAKCSTIREVANAARKWEAGIGCFIKVRLQNSRANKSRELGARS